jgi:hypothetical protein
LVQSRLLITQSFSFGILPRKTSITPLIAALALRDQYDSRVPTVCRAGSTFFVAIYSNFKNGV